MPPILLIIVVEFGGQQGFFLPGFAREFHKPNHDAKYCPPFSNYQRRPNHRQKQSGVERVANIGIRP